MNYDEETKECVVGLCASQESVKARAERQIQQATVHLEELKELQQLLESNPDFERMLSLMNRRQ